MYLPLIACCKGGQGWTWYKMPADLHSTQLTLWSTSSNTSTSITSQNWKFSPSNWSSQRNENTSSRLVRNGLSVVNTLVLPVTRAGLSVSTSKVLAGLLMDWPGRCGQDWTNTVYDPHGPHAEWLWCNLVNKWRLGHQMGQCWPGTVNNPVPALQLLWGFWPDFWPCDLLWINTHLQSLLWPMHASLN